MPLELDSVGSQYSQFKLKNNACLRVTAQGSIGHNSSDVPESRLIELWVVESPGSERDYSSSAASERVW